MSDPKRRRLDEMEYNGPLSTYSQRDEVMLDSNKNNSEQKNLLPTGPIKVTRKSL